MGPESRSQTRSVGQWWKWTRARLAPPRREDGGGAAFGGEVVDEDVDVFDAGEVADDLGVDPGDGLEFAGPVFGVVGPGDPGGGVGGPLGGHAVAGGGHWSSMLVDMILRCLTPPTTRELLLVKVDRAYEHTLRLQSMIRRFQAEGNSHEIFFKDDAQTQERTYYIRVLKSIPLEFSALIGDILQNLRSSLDHLAWHLVKSSPVTPKAADHQIYFPIFETASEYRAGKMTKIRGVTDAAMQALDAVEPYYRPDITPGIGNGVALFWLHELNKLNKHRLLIPVWEDMTAHTMPKTKLAEMEVGLRAAFGDQWENTLIVAHRPIAPLVDGSKLASLPISEVKDKMIFRFQIAFGEPKWVCGKEVLSTLVNMQRIVRELIEDFDRKGLL